MKVRPIVTGKRPRLLLVAGNTKITGNYLHWAIFLYYTSYARGGNGLFDQLVLRAFSLSRERGSFAVGIPIFYTVQ